MRTRQKIVVDQKEVMELSSQELNHVKEMIPLLEGNFNDDSMWVDGLSNIQEAMEANNFIDDMAFIAADHDYSNLINEPLLNFIQEK